MMQTLKKQIKWRKDKKAIFICDCKTLNDLKIDFKYGDFLKKLSSGIDFNILSSEERLIFLEFKKLGFLISLKTKQLPKKDFEKAMDILDNELGKKRVRSKEFLKDKYESFKRYFIGLYLGEELIGVVCGFSRENYLLMSELAVDIRFQKRGFGKLLVTKFEERAFKDYNLIKVGARDNVIDFYKSLNYFPFLLVQFNNGEYSKKDFSKFKVLSVRDWGIELELEDCSLDKINELKKKFPKANLQYIFVKNKP
jgi:ribosomal protein S18 acetylase RimI-like enzyme